MANAFQLIIKYGQYLKFLPLLVSLVKFVRTAESKYREAGSGAQKAEWVQGQLTQFIDLAEMVGLIGAQFATSLRDGAAQLITIIVRGMQEVHGAVPPLEEPPVFEPSEPPLAFASYGKALESRPDSSLLKPGDKVYQHGDEEKYFVPIPGAGAGAPSAPWHLIETIQ